MVAVVYLAAYAAPAAVIAAAVAAQYPLGKAFCKRLFIYTAVAFEYICMRYTVIPDCILQPFYKSFVVLVVPESHI